MKKYCVGILCFASAAFGLLPPLAQSTKELQTLLADPQLYRLLGSAEAIDEIRRNEEGYLVVTRNYTMQVNVEYIREGAKIGPTKFKLLFNEPVSLSPASGP